MNEWCKYPKNVIFLALNFDSSTGRKRSKKDFWEVVQERTVEYSGEFFAIPMLSDFLR